MRLRLQFIPPVLFLFGFQTTEALEKSLGTKITAACLRSAEKNKDKEFGNPRAVCECVGNMHFKSAAQEADKKEAEAHLSWTLNFYETENEKKLGELVAKNPAFSSFDDQVVESCIQKFGRTKK